MVESNEIKKVAVDAFKRMSALNVILYQQAVAKYYVESKTVAAGSSATLTINVPSGYAWIIARMNIETAANTTASNISVDKNKIHWNVGAGTTADLSPYWGRAMNIIARESVSATFSNSGTSDETSRIHLWVFEIPETALSE